MELYITAIDKILKNQEVEIIKTNIVDAPEMWKARKRANGRLWIQSYLVKINGQVHKMHRLSSEGAPHVAIETAIDNKLFKKSKRSCSISFRGDQMKIRLHSAQETKTIEGTVEEIKDYLRAIKRLPFIALETLTTPYSEKFHGLTVTFSLASKNSKRHIIAAEELKRIKEEKEKAEAEKAQQEAEKAKQEAIEETRRVIENALNDELSRIQLGKVVKFGTSKLFEVKYEVGHANIEDIIQAAKSQDLAIRIETISIKSKAETEPSISDYYGRNYDTWATTVDTKVDRFTITFEDVF